MPYARNAVIKVIGREGGPRVPFTWEVYAEDQLRRPFSRLMHFHARYRQEYPNRVFDWPFLEATGRGRFVGAALSIWNPVKGWWGEGDEKVWVDGEKFPSWFGTGSEDYFGYAWCSNQPFTHALHNQPLCEGPGNANYTAVNRWHLADNIPFQKSFRMTIENYGQDKDYASVAYWYQAPGSTHFSPTIRPTASCTSHFDTRIPGALEGENLRILAKEIAAVDPRTWAASAASGPARPTSGCGRQRLASGWIWPLPVEGPAATRWWSISPRRLTTGSPSFASTGR